MTEGDGIQQAVTAQPAVAVETVVRLSASPRSLTGDFTPAPSAVTLELVDNDKTTCSLPGSRNATHCHLRGGRRRGGRLQGAGEEWSRRSLRSSWWASESSRAWNRQGEVVGQPTIRNAGADGDSSVESQAVTPYGPSQPV